MPNSGYKQWMRQCRLIVGSLDVSDLRIRFQVEKSVNETPNYSEIIIYNLAASTVASIKAGDTVILEAGYKEGNCGLIFTGQIVQPFLTRESGVDVLLHLICQDGDEFLNSAFTAKTIQKGSKPSDVVSACATIPKNIISDKISSAPAYIRAKVMFGQSAKYLKRTAESTETQFFVNDGKVNIVGAKDFEEGMAADLNSDTGLIGDPNQTDDGVSAQCLINPSIKLNSLIHINSDSITQKALSNAESTVSSFSANGVYRIVKLTYEGDTHGDPWYCTFDAVTQDGANAAGVSSPTAASSGATGSGSDSSPGASVLAQMWR